MASGSFLVVAPAMLGVFFAFWLFTRKLSKISLNARPAVALVLEYVALGRGRGER